MGRRLTSAAGGQTVDTVTYDTLGRVATQTDSRGVTVTMTYDAAGRVTRRTMPDATHEDFTYGPNGVLTHSDRAGRTTTYTYDALGRRASETNPNSETLAYGYNLAGQMTSLTDASSNVTQWTYDTEGRLVTKTYADNSTYTYTYDAAGRLLTRTDAMNRTTTYSYDAAGRLLSVDYPDATPEVTYTYDALGRRLTMADGSGTSTWTYDAATGQPASVDGPFTDDTLSYTWDAQGRRLSTSVDGTALATYTYDALGRMATVTGAANEAFTYSYLGNSNQVASLAMPGTLSTTKTYDTLGRLSSVVNAAGNVAISAFAYTVDNGDRRTRVDLVDGGHWDYTYDNAGQLTGGTRYGPKLDQQEGTLVQYAYQYDAMGNPTQRSEDAGVSAYTFNNLNQLVTGGWSGTLSAFGSTRTQNLASVAVSTGQQTETATVFEWGDPTPPQGSVVGAWTAKGLTVPAGDTTLTVTRTATDQTTTQSSTSVTRPQAGVAYSHDLNGNLLGDGAWAYTWDCENRLVAAERAAATRLTFVYDGQSRRRILREYVWQDNAWLLTLERRYTWDGWLPVHEVTTDCTTTPVATHVDVYVRGLDLSGSLEGAGGIGGMLAVVHDGTMLCYFDNGRGDITELADPATASAAAHYEYDPFGKPIVASGSIADLNRYRFSSKEQDPTGLCYYDYRYYHPGQGRWADRDPIGEGGGANLYLFARNAGTTFADPDGRKPARPQAEACGCCCCADDVDIRGVTRIDDNLRMGHQFTVVSKLVYKKIPGKTGDCRYRWFERNTHPDNTGIPPGKQLNPGEWYDIHERWGSDWFPGWRDRLKPCGDSEAVSDTDKPALGKRVGRRVIRKLELKIVVESGSDCDCDYRRVYISAEQVLTMVNGVSVWVDPAGREASYFKVTGWGAGFGTP